MLDDPRHPYTRALAAAVPVPDPVADAERRAAGLEQRGAGIVAEPESGCPYHPRCPLVEAVCREREPALLDLGAGHLAACHLAGPAAS